MTSLGKTIISARARTALGARKSFTILVVTAVAAVGLTAVAAVAGWRSGQARRPASRHGCRVGW